MTVGKGVAGVVGNSSAMVADAAHSLSDLISDVVTLITVKLSRKPVDPLHPYGHGKYESLGALGVGGLLVMTGIGIGHHSFEHLIQPSIPSQIATWAAVISILVKEVLYQVTVRIGKKQHSQVLIANAWHHRSDAISSVLALGGIVGAQLGVPILDPIAGLVVSGLIVKLGFSTSLSSIKELTDTLEDRSFIEDIEKATRQIEGVEGCSQVRTRTMGPHVLVDMNIQVNPMLSVSMGHQVAERVRLTILKEFPRITEVLIHVNAEPEHQADIGELIRPQESIQKDVEDVLKTVPEIVGTSHVVCHFLNRKLHVEATVQVDENLRIRDAQHIATRARGLIEGISGVDHADVHLELLGNHQIQSETQRKEPGTRT